MQLFRQTPQIATGYFWEFFPGKDGKVRISKKVLAELDKQGIKYKIHEHAPKEAYAANCKSCDSVNNAMTESCDTFKKASQSEKTEMAQQMAMKQASILKAVGATNLALSLFLLATSCRVAKEVDQLEQSIPAVSSKCDSSKPASKISATTWRKR